ncbi:hypothetical protein [Ktedonobacter racemifer]|uniref:Uncharacterized protein n=1 Tax=Ktedonobacter racemifer DSM 44963 TaxID=485913 RepID=D6U275_KTERA|nr:hypothetical protein [Ktedonobacter racemifer]EFH82743.1 hypothetical protein Krac_3586 [Ktedonobacter racemifer DSM 44963]
MSKTLQFVRELFGDEGLVILKEWNGPNGSMGVYHAKDVGYIYLLVFIQSQQRHCTHQYPDTEKTQAFHDAEIIAAFAGAQEMVA